MIWWNILVFTDDLKEDSLQYVREMEEQGYLAGVTKEQWKDWVDS